VSTFNTSGRGRNRPIATVPQRNDLLSHHDFRLRPSTMAPSQSHHQIVAKWPATAGGPRRSEAKAGDGFERTGRHGASHRH
jgi:hypothetical protein